MKLTPQRALMFGLAVLLCGGLIAVILVPRSIQVEIASVNEEIFQEWVMSDGVLRSKDRHTISAFAEGDIQRIDVKIGDPLKKGQLITQLFWDYQYEPVVAPWDGVVSRVYRESAGPVRRGEPLVEMINPKRLEVVAETLTTDAARISVGSLARVENWGGEEVLEARVIRVSQAGFVKVSALGVEEERTEVTLDLVHAPAEILSHLGSTFHVDISIEVSRVAKAKVIPEGALFRDGESWAVFLVEKNQAKKRRVQILGRSLGRAWLGEGLSVGQRIIVYPGDLIHEGVKVRGDG